MQDTSSGAGGITFEVLLTPTDFEGCDFLNAVYLRMGLGLRGHTAAKLGGVGGEQAKHTYKSAAHSNRGGRANRHAERTLIRGIV